MTERTDRENAELEEVADQLAALCRRMEISGVDVLESMADGEPLPRTQMALQSVLHRIDPQDATLLFVRMRTYGATLRQAQDHSKWEH